MIRVCVILKGLCFVANFGPLQIIKRANERGVDPISLSAQFCQEFLDDMADLQCLPPTQQPRVSDHMEQIKDMISQVRSSNYFFPNF